MKQSVMVSVGLVLLVFSMPAAAQVGRAAPVGVVHKPTDMGTQKSKLPDLSNGRMPTEAERAAIEAAAGDSDVSPYGEEFDRRMERQTFMSGMEKIYDHMDSNGDGTVSLNEAVGGKLPQTLPQPKKSVAVVTPAVPVAPVVQPVHKPANLSPVQGIAPVTGIAPINANPNSKAAVGR